MTPRPGPSRRSNKSWLIVGGALLVALVLGVIIGAVVLGGNADGGPSEISGERVATVLTDSGMESDKADCVTEKLTDAAGDGPEALDEGHITELMTDLIDDCDFELDDVGDLQQALRTLQQHHDG